MISSYWPLNISRWNDLILQYSTQYAINGNLIAAQMMVESGGNPDATGAAGELGLLQIMPRYHLCASYNPEANISCGTSILAGHYRGNWRDALARYNAGATGASMGLGYTYADRVLELYEESEMK